MLRKKSLALYCFSPPVMLVTFIIEISFAIYTLYRYKLNVVTRLVVSLLVLLAVFQGTEYLLCGGFGVPGGVWSKFGYAAITVLPPLGIHLIHAITGRKLSALTIASYVSGAAFIGYFVFATQAISGHTCYANYVTFDMQSGSSLIYGAYYYGWLLVGIYLSLAWAPTVSIQKAKALYALMIGYVCLLVPTTTVNLIIPDSLGGIPSIMCGFAIILAGLIATRVVPNTVGRK